MPDFFHPGTPSVSRFEIIEHLLTVDEASEPSFDENVET
jgi:hypothetical protein